MKDISEYEDIINLPHFVSKKYKEISKEERAIQFAPFAALKEHEEQIALAAEENEKSVENELK